MMLGFYLFIFARSFCYWGVSGLRFSAAVATRFSAAAARFSATEAAAAVGLISNSVSLIIACSGLMNVKNSSEVVIPLSCNRVPSICYDGRQKVYHLGVSGGLLVTHCVVVE